MSSILTNNSAMSALQSLAATQKSLSQTQNQISTGLRVSDASDNAAYWSIATTMKSDTGALSAVSDALNLGSSTLGVATAALNSTLTIMNKMKADLVTAQTPGTDKTQVQSDISALQQSLRSIVSSASFNGVNLLNNSTSNTNIVSSFSRSTSGATSVGTISIPTGSTTLIDSAVGTATSGNGILAQTGTSGVSIIGLDVSSASSASMTAMSTDIDAAIKSLTAAAAKLGGTKVNVDNQSTFVSALSDAITSGVGSLVDADMNLASTRLQALQTQQQLGVQALSIANQNSQMIMKLFNG